MLRGGLIAVANLRERREYLCPFINPLNRPKRGFWIICGNVLEDILEPASSFVGPCYRCHERIRRPISWFEMVRFASESARLRSTIT